ncbi:hypothetical protein PGQ11_012508 [Apiospora arundinis]|uniref:Uncharacterized protein n=1 Tax=Apiospora arundinis TaxID=335852 RepID=A0ABR2I2P6_9PEZI
MYEYPKFTEKDFRLLDKEKAEDVRQYLAKIHDRGVGAVLNIGQVVQNTKEEVVINHHVHGFSVRVTQMRDVSVDDQKSYRNTARSRRLESLSDQKMSEAPISRNVKNMLMARQINRGEAPPIPMVGGGIENRKAWYKTMRAESQKTFWLGTSREERDALRDEGQEDNLQSHPVLEPLVAQIEQEDKGSQSKTSSSF